MLQGQGQTCVHVWDFKSAINPIPTDLSGAVSIGKALCLTDLLDLISYCNFPAFVLGGKTNKIITCDEAIRLFPESYLKSYLRKAGVLYGLRKLYYSQVWKKRMRPMTQAELSGLTSQQKPRFNADCDSFFYIKGNGNQMEIAVACMNSVTAIGNEAGIYILEVLFRGTQSKIAVGHCFSSNIQHFYLARK